jgi:hypothetical protein
MREFGGAATERESDISRQWTARNRVQWYPSNAIETLPIMWLEDEQDMLYVVLPAHFNAHVPHP